MVGRCVCGGKVGQSGRERRGRWKAKGKCEVKELGATEMRGRDGRRQSGNDAWRPNLRSREIEAPLVRRASITRMGISIAAFFENSIGTGVASHTFFLHASITYHARHSPPLTHRITPLPTLTIATHTLPASSRTSRHSSATSYFVLRTTYFHSPASSRRKAIAHHEARIFLGTAEVMGWLMGENALDAAGKRDRMRQAATEVVILLWQLKYYSSYRHAMHPHGYRVSLW